MTGTDTPRSAADMMSGLMGNVSNLVRNEVDLARAETAESLSRVGGILAWMAVALVLGIVGLNLLAVSLVSALVWAGLDPQWATLAVGLGLLVLAAVVLLSARSALHQIGFMPTRTARNVQRDAAAIRNSLHEQ
ncbi:phage holin family protein [Rhodobaculum claviforme]|uniref:Holin-X, holin superfamily III n=1 Tax=Rhodobaculum claviforme TaxID=1549854 RepID=A0A934TJ31_9RHOB|nr:phage holin family protein [Rhodobaculum claviforme]MBK5926436.1 hypothetical protein [Rhodobaculum claviforme]